MDLRHTASPDHRGPQAPLIAAPPLAARVMCSLHRGGQDLWTLWTAGIWLGGEGLRLSAPENTRPNLRSYGPARTDRSRIRQLGW